MDVLSAKEKFDAGAALVQIYTGLVYRGPQLVKSLRSTLNARLLALLNARLEIDHSHAGSFARPRRCFHVLCDGGKQDRLKRLPLRSHLAGHSDSK